MRVYVDSFVTVNFQMISWLIQNVSAVTAIEVNQPRVDRKTVAPIENKMSPMQAIQGEMPIGRASECAGAD